MQNKPTPQYLRSTYIQDLAQDKEAPVGVRIQHAQLIWAEDPAQSKQLLEDILDKHPAHEGAVLVAMLSNTLLIGGYEEIRQLVERIRSIDSVKPYWVDRLLSTFERQRIELNGLALVFDDRTLSPKVLRALCTGRYEHQEVEILKRKADEEDRILELGGGIGYLGLVAKKMFPDMSYVSFEANPDLIEMIQKNQALNNCQYTIRNQLVGVGGRKLPFFIDRDCWISSLTPTRNTVKTVQVDEISIQDALEINAPNFLIIDIEGGESQLVPMMDFTRIDKCLIELHPNRISNEEYTAILRTIMDRGFILDGRESRGQVFYFYKP